MKNKLVLLIGLFCFNTICVAGNDNFGQNLQITTRLNSFVGRPTWLIEIRDLDHNQTIPYLYDITKNDNFWLAFTYGRNYVITASRLQFSPYRSNPYSSRRINNFCHLESHGSIQRGVSLAISLEGDLTPNSNTYRCNITRFADANFSAAPADQ